MYFREMIEEHENVVGITERNDIFGAMLAVNINNPKDSPNEQLSERELLGIILSRRNRHLNSHNYCRKYVRFHCGRP